MFNEPTSVDMITGAGTMAMVLLGLYAYFAPLMGC